MATKIFVFGSLNGQLKSAFTKLATLHSKNNFAFAIVTGNLFAAEDNDNVVSGLLNGTITVPIPTYFTVGSLPLPPRIVEKVQADEEICENLHYLGKRSVTKTSEGVRIVALGGLLDSAIIGGQSQEQHLPLHTADDAKALRGANSADILLTTMWPSAVWNRSKLRLPVDQSTIPTSDAVADLCALLKPKYHFATAPSDFFFEREPFSHPPKDEGMLSNETTRFLSLAGFGNGSKAKSMYAFSLPKEAATSLPADVTWSPFYNPRKRQPLDTDGGYSHFSRDDGGHRNKRRRSPPPGPDKCFFCLSNPNLPSHMVCAIGDEAYIATAKGPLPTSHTFIEQGLDFPAHLVAVPLSHEATVTSAAMGQADAAKTFTDLTRFRESFQAMVSSTTKRKLGTVAWEINRKRGIHAHWQFMPVSADMVIKGLVEAAFKVQAENQKLPKFEECDFGIGDEVEGDFFRVWIFAEEEDAIISKGLLMRFDENIRFDLQFGRRVMAKLVGLESRLTWQDCAQTEEEEKKDVAAFQKAFGPWDFTKE